MLARICLDSNLDDNVVKAYQKFMVEIVAERDLSAQETCYMLQKFPLVNCNHRLMSLNVGQNFLHHLKQTSAGSRIESSYIQAYMEHPTELQQLTLIE